MTAFIFLSFPAQFSLPLKAFPIFLTASTGFSGRTAFAVSPQVPYFMKKGFFTPIFLDILPFKK